MIGEKTLINRDSKVVDICTANCWTVFRMIFFNPFTSDSIKSKIQNFQNYNLVKIEKQTALRKSTDQQRSNEWSHFMVLSIGPKVGRLWGSSTQSPPNPRCVWSDSTRIRRHRAVCHIHTTALRKYTLGH